MNTTNGVRTPHHWILLIGIQILISIILFEAFFIGSKQFAYTDIGSDTYFQFVPKMIHLANYVAQGNWTEGWTFFIGLGTPMSLPINPFSWLSIAGGANHVIDLRIWVYVAKLLVGGWAFHAFLRRLPVDSTAALIGAIAYTFCGYATINGQWDPHATELAFYPIILWAFAHRIQGGTRFLLPIVIAIAALSDIFIVSLCVFTFWCFILSVLVSNKRLEHTRIWIQQVIPLVIAGLTLASPLLLPSLIQMLDSPRVSGTQALFSERLAELFSINDTNTLLVEIAGLFHKDILGVGGYYRAWMNYLEGPGFYIGTLPLLAIPQLWQDKGLPRKILLVGITFTALYFAFPAIRYLTFAFAIQYFRTSTLWISLLLLGLSVFALDGALRRGVHKGLLVGTSFFAFGAPLMILALFPKDANPEHIVHILIFTSIGVTLLGFTSRQTVPPHWLRWALLLVVCVEAIVISYPSFHKGRLTVNAFSPTYADGSYQAIRQIQKNDPGPYRIEKTFDSVSLTESLAQGYFGVKSYWFHGSSVIRFFVGLGLIPEQSKGVNYTNWLPNFGNRFPLYSLVGVKYMISRTPLNWPGFKEIGSTSGVRVSINELALPLGVIHYQQISEESFQQAPRTNRDMAMFNGVITNTPIPDMPVLLMESLNVNSMDSLSTLYAQPAEKLRRGGLTISSFNQDKIIGEITATAKGILVLSIPFYPGWAAKIDGEPARVFRANLGMTAIELTPGKHDIELYYRTPGLLPSAIVALITLLTLIASGPLFRHLQLKENKTQRITS